MDARRRPGGPAWHALALLATMTLLAVAPPAGAWYKHVASPRYHTVGRASGLLMGVRRSPYLWRRQLEGAARGGRLARRAPWWPPLPLQREGPAPWTSREPTTRWAGAGRGKRERDPWALQGAPDRRPATDGRSAAPAPQLPRRDPWAALCPAGCPDETPWRSAAPAPEQLERATRKGRWSQEPEAEAAR